MSASRAPESELRFAAASVLTAFASQLSQCHRDFYLSLARNYGLNDAAIIDAFKAGMVIRSEDS